MTHSTAPHLPPIDPTVPHISAPHIPHCPTHFSLTHLCPTHPWGLFLECRGQEWLHVERSRREVGTAVTPVAPVVMSAVTSSVTSSSTSAVTSSGLWGSPTALGSEGEMWDEGMGGGKGDANIYGVRPKWDPNIYGAPRDLWGTRWLCRSQWLWGTPISMGDPTAMGTPISVGDPEIYGAPHSCRDPNICGAP